MAGVKLEIHDSPAPATLKGAKRSTPEFDLVLRVDATQTEKLCQRLEKEIEQLEKVIAGSERQLSSEEFVSRAPEAVVKSIREKLADYESRLEKSRDVLAGLAR